MIRLLRVLLLSFCVVPLLSVQTVADVHPDQIRKPDVPQGQVTSGQFSDSEIFPGTVRDYSVYVPAQYKPEEPAALMVFMDGRGYSDPERSYRVPIVFDNLIHQGAMPVTIAVFVNPGTVPATAPGAAGRRNRALAGLPLGAVAAARSGYYGRGRLQ